MCLKQTFVFFKKERYLMLRKMKHLYCFGLAAIVTLVLACQSFAGTSVYVSYSSGRTMTSCAPQPNVYVVRPVYVCPEPVYYDSSAITVSFGGSSGGHHYYRPQYRHGDGRHYDNPPMRRKYEHRRW